jgi:gluconolactonase
MRGIERPEVVATGLQFGEGPVWCPARDGVPASLVCTAVAAGAVERVDLAAGTVTRVADVGGGANAAILASDGGFLVTQNGGIDFTRVGLYDDPPPYRPVTPGLQRVRADGAVDYVVDASSDGPFLAPNDLVVDDEGAVWFTDPPHHPPPAEPAGRVHVLTAAGTTRVVAWGFRYCNGIALEPGGTLVVVEALGLVRIGADAVRETVTEHVSPAGNAGDGLCVDEEGRLYVATTADHGIRVLEPDGTQVDFLEIPGQGITTNCCFGGDDGRTLFATDGVPGQVLAWEGMPTRGLAVHAWPVDPASG